MGAHGEPGVSRQKLLQADPLVDDMMERLLADLPFQSGDEVALVINDMGATTMMELLVVNRRVRQLLHKRNIAVYSTDIGSYLTTQEMAGFSITLMKLDAELKTHLDLPVSSFAYTKS